MYDKKSMTKKAWKQKQKEMRKMNGFNTGERMFDTPKRQSCAKNKKDFQKILDKECGKYYN